MMQITCTHRPRRGTKDVGNRTKCHGGKDCLLSLGHSLQDQWLTELLVAAILSLLFTQNQA